MAHLFSQYDTKTEPSKKTVYVSIEAYLHKFRLLQDRWVLPGRIRLPDRYKL